MSGTPSDAVRTSWRRIADLDPPDPAGAALLVALRRHIPRRTGRLQRSARLAEAGVVVVSAPYARVIDAGWRAHNIEPARYADRAAADALDRVAAVYAAAAQNELDRI